MHLVVDWGAISQEKKGSFTGVPDRASEKRRPSDKGFTICCDNTYDIRGCGVMRV